MRTAELTLPGFRARRVLGDPSARRRLAVPAPRCRSRSTGSSGSAPPAALAHPFDDGTAALLERSPTRRRDARRGRRGATGELMAPLAEPRRLLLADLLGPLRAAGHPARARALRVASALPASVLARTTFRGERARGTLRRARGALDAAALVACHRRRSGSCCGLLGHSVGWPLARGGSQSARGRAGVVPALARRRDRDRIATSARSPSSTVRAPCCSTSRPRS